ncbi:uncharacterized protein METZ01_LOCUS21961 [marine metagenome]|uniref:Uncharacterized protein n=1 Tax=marine metagenome TaxID=408172 RepID=A0A381PSR5_9ZZZZ
MKSDLSNHRPPNSHDLRNILRQAKNEPI